MAKIPFLQFTCVNRTAWKYKQIYDSTHGRGVRHHATAQRRQKQIACIAGDVAATQPAAPAALGANHPRTTPSPEASDMMPAVPSDLPQASTRLCLCGHPAWESPLLSHRNGPSRTVMRSATIPQDPRHHLSMAPIAVRMARRGHLVRIPPERAGLRGASFVAAVSTPRPSPRSDADGRTSVHMSARLGANVCSQAHAACTALACGNAGRRCQAAQRAPETGPDAADVLRFNGDGATGRSHAMPAMRANRDAAKIVPPTGLAPVPAI
jgi:hypothetical protein